MACPYATLLGKRGEGVHSSRIMGFAMNDILATIVVALLTSWIYNVSFLYSFMVWFILGEILHLVFGVDTRFLELIGLKPSCDVSSA
jgi:hypothetical protein